MVIISHSFKTLLSLLGFLTPQIDNFSILSPWNFFGLVPYPTYLFTFYFLELCRNYMSIIITIIGNNTVLVSHNLILFWFFMSMSHGVKKKRLLQVSPSSSIPPTSVLPGLFVVLQEILYQPSFAVIRLFAKDISFSKKIRFFLLAYCWSVLILLFCLYVFFTTFFFSQFCHCKITNLKLFYFFQIPRKLTLIWYYLHSFKLLNYTISGI